MRDSAYMSTGTVPLQDLKSDSEVFDEIRMKGLKFPHQATHLTKKSAEEFGKRSQTNSYSVKALLITMGIPLVAGAAYLIHLKQEVQLEKTSSSKSELTKIEVLNAAYREPVLANPVTHASQTTVPSREAAIAPTPGPIKIELDSEGKMISPFSLVLDENGNEESRKEIEETYVLLPPLPLGEFEKVKILSDANITKGFAMRTESRPFIYSDAERLRLTLLRASAPEIKRVFELIQAFATSRMQISPLAVESFEDPRIDSKLIASAQSELAWTTAAAFVREIHGDQSAERRLIETIKLWVATYKPTGNAKAELPFMDLLIAYSYIRHLLGAPDQVMIDDFFKSMINAQFTRLKAHKVYDANHAAHVYCVIAVGYVIDNSAFQLHGQTQFKFHIEHSKALKQDSYGTETVETLKHLFGAAYVLERAGTLEYQNVNLQRAAAILATASQSQPPTLLVEAVARAAYFRGDLYGTLPTLARGAGLLDSRFGTHGGAILAAIRKPTLSLVPNSQVNRSPTSLPPKLPEKRR